MGSWGVDWQLCSYTISAIHGCLTAQWTLNPDSLRSAIGLFVACSPERAGRQSESEAPPIYVYLDLILLLGACAVLASNAIGWPLGPNAGLYALGLTSVLFVSGIGYLHALGAVRHATGAWSGDADLTCKRRLAYARPDKADVQ